MSSGEGPTVVLLTGGRSPRLEMLSDGVPKSFISILGRPLVEYILEGLAEARPRKIVLVTDREDYARRVVERASVKNIVLARQREPGIVGAYRSSIEFLDREDRYVLVVYGDIVVDKSVYRSIISYAEEDLSREDFGGVLLGVAEEPRTHHWLIESNELGLVERVVPSRISGEGYIAGGLYLVRREFFDLLAGREDLYTVFNEYVKRWKTRILYWGHYWIDIGGPWDLLRAVYVLLGQVRESRISSDTKISRNTVIEGPVVIEDGVEIDHFATIKGPVYIGRGSFIGAYSFIRGSVVEDRVFISSYTEINRSLVMTGATIGRNSYLSHSVVGVGAVIEPGVIIKSLLHQRREDAYRVVSRGREFSKLGGVVYARARVASGKIIEPGGEEEKES